MSFHDKVVYQIYPKSYNDSNGDGFGDLQGIIAKLPYLADLGVDILWLNPFYPSPQNDNGYDISDYTAIDPRFGTMADFEELVQKAKDLGMGLMLDMVLNHVSTEHAWFQKALAGDKKYQDYFILRDEPNNWPSKFGGNAWAPFGDTGKYYLHLYDVTQADLNWRNPEVREELQQVVNFWLDKGASGFRFDVINVIGKDEELRSSDINDAKGEYTDTPIVHDYLQELNAKTFGQHPNVVTVGEMSSTTIENCIMYTAPDRHELSMTFNFHHLKVDYKDGQKWTDAPVDFPKLQHLLHSWNEGMSAGNGWNAWFWNNHDQPRALNRFIDVENFRVAGAKMLAASIHLNRGTPYVYMGEEIGMLDPNFDSMDDYVDIESLNAYREMQEAGLSADEAFKIVTLKSRDNSRTPMQWDASENAGFSTGTPWLQVGRSYKDINVAVESHEGSILPFYKRLIALRKTMPVIAEGDYQPWAETHESVYAYIRRHEDASLLVLNNFANHAATVTIPAEFVNGDVLVTNYENTAISTTEVELAPYQTLAIMPK